MAAIKKEELEELEKLLELEAGDLTYQQRCSRVSAYKDGRGEQWEQDFEKSKPKAPVKKIPMFEAPPLHPLYHKRLLISPMMQADKNRADRYEELLGPDIKVQEAHAGEMIHAANDPNLDRVVGDYVVLGEDTRNRVMALSGLPKINTEITWLIGGDLSNEIAPVVRGEHGERGYIWSFPTCDVQIDDTMFHIQSLQTLVRTIYPDLLPEFSGKPMMSYIEGVSLAASIPLTNALLLKRMRQAKLDDKAGIN